MLRDENRSIIVSELPESTLKIHIQGTPRAHVISMDVVYIIKISQMIRIHTLIEDTH